LRSKGNSFLDFVKHVNPWFVVEEVHCLVADHLEKLRHGEIDRLMIMMPPRTGKSLMTSELLPAWWAGHYPSDKILHASYASTLVEKFGRKIRNMIMSGEYAEVFPKTQVSKDSRSAGQWATTEGGEYNAVGVGGGVAGKGGNLLLCVATDTVVTTRSGASAAGDVVVGTDLLSTAGWGRVVKKVLTTHKERITINSNLTCSLNHPVWVRRRGWVEAGKLRVGDIVQTQTLWSKAWQKLISLRNALSERAGRL
jgi:hypothetical protein